MKIDLTSTALETEMYAQKETPSVLKKNFLGTHRKVGMYE